MSKTAGWVNKSLAGAMQAAKEIEEAGCIKCRAEQRQKLIEEIEKEGYWGQVPHIDLAKGKIEKTMWCLPEKWWQQFKRGE
jgi:hypothetical protein